MKNEVIYINQVTMLPKETLILNCKSKNPEKKPFLFSYSQYVPVLSPHLNNKGLLT